MAEMLHAAFQPRALPAMAGVGLRHPHVTEVIEDRPELAWVEVHTENYMVRGGPRLRQLELVRENYPVSFHGVGLSLGSAEEPDMAHLGRIKALTDRFEPGMLSEHVAWCTTGGAYLNDLLPIPYTEEALAVIARNVAIAQDFLGRRVLIENPSSYLRFRDSTIPECVFVAEVAERAGCGILLDVNNIVVSAHNHGFDADDYLDTIPLDAVGELHLAGHARREVDGQEILIDDHASAVTGRVWALYEKAVARFGPLPTLIEWDAAIPPLAVLQAEAAKAQAILDARRQGMRHAA